MNNHLDGAAADWKEVRHFASLVSNSRKALEGFVSDLSASKSGVTEFQCEKLLTYITVHAVAKQGASLAILGGGKRLYLKGLLGDLGEIPEDIQHLLDVGFLRALNGGIVTSASILDNLLYGLRFCNRMTQISRGKLTTEEKLDLSVVLKATTLSDLDSIIVETSKESCKKKNKGKLRERLCGTNGVAKSLSLCKCGGRKDNCKIWDKQLIADLDKAVLIRNSVAHGLDRATWDWSRDAGLTAKLRVDEASSDESPSASHAIEAVSSFMVASLRVCRVVLQRKVGRTKPKNSHDPDPLLELLKTVDNLIRWSYGETPGFSAPSPQSSPTG